jgi:DnaJ-class molecular chaperone
MGEFVTGCTGSTCDARIVFSDVPTGKRHPYDYPVPACDACDGRGFFSVERVQSMFDGGGVKIEREDCVKCKGRGKLYVSHYVTCPNAGEFRHGKQAAE